MPLLSTAYDSDMKNQGAVTCKLAVAPSEIQLKPLCLTVVERNLAIPDDPGFVPLQSPRPLSLMVSNGQHLDFIMLLSLVCCQAAPHQLNCVEEKVNHRAVKYS